MAMGSVNLSSSMRTNLVALQSTASMLASTETKLSTGNKVNSAVDNPASFFAAQNETQRAGNLGGLKDNISEAIATVNAASNGITGETSLIQSLRGVITQARSAINDKTTSGSVVSGLAKQYNELVRQVNNLVFDSSYQGTNFLTGTGSTLNVNFNESATTSLVMKGFNAGASGLGLSGAGGSSTQFSGLAGNLGAASLSTSANLNAMEKLVNTSLATLQTQSSALANNLSALTARQSFITSMVNTLSVGATSLTGADTNQESANLLTLQTQNQLGVTALSMSNQANQAVLKLF